jgi:hypothetical protein
MLALLSGFFPAVILRIMFIGEPEFHTLFGRSAQISIDMGETPYSIQ